MKLTLQLFAGLAEHFGKSELKLEVPTENITVDQLKTVLVAQFPQSAGLINQCFVARNQMYALEQDQLIETDEVALIPPVSGGQESSSIPMEGSQGIDEHFIITNEPLSVEEITAKVVHPLHGAVISFVGTTREFTYGKQTTYLEYEAYVPMALRTMEQIGREIDERWPGTICAISHRLGKVDIAEISVVIAVSSAHRAEAYEASRYAIERLKQIVPIWKKEIWQDGSEWKGHQQGPWNPLHSSS